MAYNFDKFTPDGNKVYETLLSCAHDPYRQTYFTNSCLLLIQKMYECIEHKDNQNAYLNMEIGKLKKEKANGE